MTILLSDLAPDSRRQGHPWTTWLEVSSRCGEPPCETAADAMAAPNRRPSPSRNRAQRMRTTTRSGRASLSSMIESGFAPRRSSSAMTRIGLVELATVRRRAHVERDGVLADDERHLAVRLDVDLLERRARASGVCS